MLSGEGLRFFLYYSTIQGRICGVGRGILCWGHDDNGCVTQGSNLKHLPYDQRELTAYACYPVLKSRIICSIFGCYMHFSLTDDE